MEILKNVICITEWKICDGYLKQMKTERQKNVCKISAHQLLPSEHSVSAANLKECGLYDRMKDMYQITEANEDRKRDELMCV